MDAFLNALDRPFDLSQTYLGNIACCGSENVYGRRGVELMHPFKALRTDKRLGIDTKSGQHGICHACLHSDEEPYAKIILIILLKKAAFFIIGQLMQVVRDIVRTEVDGGGNDRITDLFSLLVIINKTILQSFDNVTLIFGFDAPNIKRLVFSVMRITYIKHVFEIVSISSSFDQSDTRCSSLYPSTKVIVPQLRFRTSGRVGSLSIDKNLVCKRVFVLIRCRGQKSSPSNRVRCDVFYRPLIQFGNQVNFSRHCFCSFF